MFAAESATRRPRSSCKREGASGERAVLSLDPHIARFGFTATKTLGGAVVRNRARRRLKEAVSSPEGPTPWRAMIMF